MKTLTPAERRALRAKAHHLHPVVAVGQHGLTPAVLHEIDVALLAHELIKIRVFSDERAEREALLERICAGLGAAAVQHLGKILVVWRPAPEEEAPPKPERKADRKPKAKAAAGPRRAPRGTATGAAARSPAGATRARSPAAGAKPPARAPRARGDRFAPRDAGAGEPAARRRPAGRGTAQPVAGVPSSPARRRRRSH